VRGRGFAPKGQTPVVRVNRKRHGLSVISTVTNKGQMRWRIVDGALNTAILIDFLGRLIKGATKKLNPDEMANADLKQAVTKLAPACTKLQLVKATAKHLRSVQRQPERIRKYFEHGPVRPAA
jgi:hypothetical protein